MLDDAEHTVPSAEEIAACEAVLRRLSADTLELPEFESLLATGRALFKRSVLQGEFGREDVLQHLKEKHEHKAMLRKLSKLQAQIAEHHAARCQEANKAEINQFRKDRMDAIESRPARLLAVSAATCAMSALALKSLTDSSATEDGKDSDSTIPAAVVEPGVVDVQPASVDQDDVDCDETSIDAIRATAALPQGSFRRFCNICKGRFWETHHFYHQLCPSCAAFNWQKRHQTADMRGFVCVVTGGRVRIGYQIVLKLLRAGAHVLTTTRYPADAALRYAQEPDFGDFATRLEVLGPLELSDVGLVERFCDELCARFGRIHVLINNAAQTLTRAAGWFARMDAMEEAAAAALPPCARRVLIDATQVLQADAVRSGRLLTLEPSEEEQRGDDARRDDGQMQDCAEGRVEGRDGVAGGSTHGAVDAVARVCCEGAGESAAGVAAEGAGEGVAQGAEAGAGGADDAAASGLAAGERAADAESTRFKVVGGHMVGGFSSSTEADLAFPLHKLDESAQPLDLSAQNSWSRKLGQVSTSELLHTIAANSVAPFVLCGRLRAVLSPDAEDAQEAEGGTPTTTSARSATHDSPIPWGHIVNVSALEGKFGVAKKQSCHPHTNMAKAALNMLTCSSAIGLYQERILINSVDTGWVTDMAPGGVGVLAATHQTQVGPPLDEVDGAARVLDPVFSHLLDNAWKTRGKLWKDYKVSAW